MFDYNCNCQCYNSRECVPVPGRYAIPSFPLFDPALVPIGYTWLPNGTIVTSPSSKV